jgi:hypothetical protein
LTFFFREPDIEVPSEIFSEITVTARDIQQTPQTVFILHEICNSEFTYIKDLQRLIEVICTDFSKIKDFYLPIKQAPDAEDTRIIQDSNQISLIFNNVEEIYSLHLRIGKQLEKLFPTLQQYVENYKNNVRLFAGDVVTIKNVVTQICSIFNRCVMVNCC